MQSEKMAFLGELTAGIAHELQNPRAFVKNFAGISVLLVDDMSSEPTPANGATDGQKLLLAGLRAKDKSFMAARSTHLAEYLPLLPVAAPDRGRVFLNLFSNAFYAVRQRQQGGEAGYNPAIHLCTRLLPPGHVEVRIRNNGPGIPAAVGASIFQPFFTTQTAGEGTGLGLALAHDIVVRDHGGTITVDSHESEFTEFIICLPVPAA